ncbi:unnamed protein product [Blepharisma stoltei]|uniref:proteasome endopeptidase complex n=1 Tax=Blepharisma stoltei TaxID=1481888 RepID=A0AAU9K2P7_9CILI|nr:unnamed protein product [Blepharisma stoltei]
MENFAIEPAPSDLSKAGIYLNPDVNGMGQERMGTSIMAAIFNGGVIFGADTRTTMGAYVASRISDKIECIHEKIFCCRTGVSAHTQALARYVRYYLSQHVLNEGKLPLVLTAARLLQELLYQNKAFLEGGFIVGGWDPVNGSQLYEVALGGTLVSQRYALMGSGSTYIYGYCDAEFREGMSQEECTKFIKKGLALAMARDGGSGGCERLLVVTPETVTREYVPQEEFPYNLR